MTIKEFLSDSILKILSQMVALMALLTFLFLINVNIDILLIILIVWLIFMLVAFFLEWHRANSKLEELTKIMNGLDKKYLFSECIPVPKSIYEKKMLNLIKQSGKSMIESVSDAEAEKQEYQEFIESWVHEIKAPITTAKLLCTNNKSDVTRKILTQTTQIEEHIERVLYYARASSIEKDFVIKETSLADIVSESIARFRPLLIQNNMTIETDNLDELVYTDSKWVDFIIGQLISNAVRYKSENPKIKISAQKVADEVALSFEDNGIGIARHDLKRVFERSFTGSNGRDRGGSTGMGLYLCKKLAAALNIDIGIDSNESKYTKVIMVFPSKSNLSKM